MRSRTVAGAPGVRWDGATLNAATCIGTAGAPAYAVPPTPDWAAAVAGSASSPTAGRSSQERMTE